MTLVGEHSVTIYAKVDTRDAAGGRDYSSVAASSGTTLPCTVHPASTQERVDHLQRGYQVSYKLYFKQDPSSGHGDKIAYGDATLFQVGKTIHRDESEALEFWKVYASEVEQRQ